MLGNETPEQIHARRLDALEEWQDEPQTEPIDYSEDKEIQFFLGGMDKGEEIGVIHGLTQARIVSCAACCLDRPLFHAGGQRPFRHRTNNGTIPCACSQVCHLLKMFGALDFEEVPDV